MWFSAASKDLYDNVNLCISAKVIFYFMVFIKRVKTRTSVWSTYTFQMLFCDFAFPIVFYVNLYIYKSILDTFNAVHIL
jgi:hypothetical protein